MLANKTDLIQENHVILSEKAKEIADGWQVAFMEASAKDRYNVDEAFQYLVETILKIQEEKNKTKHNGKLQKRSKKKTACLQM